MFFFINLCGASSGKYFWELSSVSWKMQGVSLCGKEVCCTRVSRNSVLSVVADSDGSSLSSPSSISEWTIDAATAKAALFPGAPRACERALHVRFAFPGPAASAKSDTQVHSEHTHINTSSQHNPLTRTWQSSHENTHNAGVLKILANFN